MRAEDVLDQCAAAAAIDRAGEASFDSFEFPKVVFLDQLADDATCDYCRMPF